MRVCYLKIEAVNSLVQILKAEGVERVCTFPTSVFNNACDEEDVPNFMVRDERYAVAVADGFSRVSNGKRFGVPSTARAKLSREKPAWIAAYDDVKVLNNFVAELLNVQERPKEARREYTFTNPRDGWVFISSKIWWMTSATCVLTKLMY